MIIQLWAKAMVIKLWSNRILTIALFLPFPIFSELIGTFLADHSERSFYKELVKVIEASDVILEVLDARDPLGTRCLDMEKMILKADPNKRIILLLNKIGTHLAWMFFNKFQVYWIRYQFLLLLY